MKFSFPSRSRTWQFLVRSLLSSTDWTRLVQLEKLGNKERKLADAKERSTPKWRVHRDRNQGRYDQITHGSVSLRFLGVLSFDLENHFVEATGIRSFRSMFHQTGRRRVLRAYDELTFFSCHYPAGLLLIAESADNRSAFPLFLGRMYSMPDASVAKVSSNRRLQPPSNKTYAVITIAALVVPRSKAV
jgi:hypothetical protein